MPDEPEVHGLLALLLLTDSRRAARVGDDGSIVLLADQDRTRWDHEQAAEGRAIVAACIRRGLPGPYQLQAAINAVHSEAASADETDWPQILRIYDQLLVLVPTPVVALNRAVALAEVEGPAAALAVVDGLELDGYQHFHATRADLLLRLGHRADAVAAYDRAIELDHQQRRSGRSSVERRRGGVAQRPDAAPVGRQPSCTSSVASTDRATSRQSAHWPADSAVVPKSSWSGPTLTISDLQGGHAAGGDPELAVGEALAGEHAGGPRSGR